MSSPFPARRYVTLWIVKSSGNGWAPTWGRFTFELFSDPNQQCTISCPRLYQTRTPTDPHDWHSIAWKNSVDPNVTHLNFEIIQSFIPHVPSSPSSPTTEYYLISCKVRFIIKIRLMIIYLIVSWVGADVVGVGTPIQMCDKRRMTRAAADPGNAAICTELTKDIGITDLD